MGLFDWLPWLTKHSRLPIGVWPDEASRYDALAAGVADDLRRGAHVLLVAHFPATLVALGERLAAKGVAFETRAEWSDAAARKLVVSQEPTAVALLAAALPPLRDREEIVRQELMAGSRTLSFRIVDLHLLAAANDRVENYARSLPCAVRLSTSVALDGPLLRELAAPWLRDLLGKLGLRDGASIEDAMVTRSLRQALQKLARRVTGDAPADSLAAWLQQNLRRGR